MAVSLGRIILRLDGAAVLDAARKTITYRQTEWSKQQYRGCGVQSIVKLLTKVVLPPLYEPELIVTADAARIVSVAHVLRPKRRDVTQYWGISERGLTEFKSYVLGVRWGIPGAKHFGGMDFAEATPRRCDAVRAFWFPATAPPEDSALDALARLVPVNAELAEELGR